MNVADGIVRGRRIWSPRKALHGAALSVVIFAWACERPAPPAGPAPPAPVTVATVQVRDMPVEILAIGNVEPIARVMLKPQVDGQLIEAHFAEGQDVHAGDLLLVIDRRPFEAALAEAQARLAKDTAMAEDAARAAEQIAEALASHAMSQRDADKARADADAARAQVQADAAAIDVAELRLEYCEIRAPLDGRAGALLVKPGNVVEANQTELVEVNQISPIYVSFAIPEQHLGQIKAEQARGPLAVRATIPGVRGADAAAATASAIAGELTFIDNKVDVTTGTIRLKGTFANQDRALWPGQFVNVVLVVATERGVVVAPGAAVQTGQKGPYVFVVKEDKTVEQRSIVPGRTIDDETVIREGLTSGETVVTDGQLRLTPGARVAVAGGSVAASAPTAARASDGKGE